MKNKTSFCLALFLFGITTSLLALPMIEEDNPFPNVEGWDTRADGVDAHNAGAANRANGRWEDEDNTSSQMPRGTGGIAEIDDALPFSIEEAMDIEKNFEDAIITYPYAPRLIIQEGEIVPPDPSVISYNIDHENQEIMRLLKNVITVRYSLNVANSVPELNQMSFVRAKDLSANKIKQIISRLDISNNEYFSASQNNFIPRLKGGGPKTRGSTLSFKDKNSELFSLYDECDRNFYWRSGVLMNKKQARFWEKAADRYRDSLACKAYAAAFSKQATTAREKTHFEIGDLWMKAVRSALSAAQYYKEAAEQYSTKARSWIILSSHITDSNASDKEAEARDHWYEVLHTAREAADKTRMLDPEIKKSVEAFKEEQKKAKSTSRNHILGGLVSSFVFPTVGIPMLLVALDNDGKIPKHDLELLDRNPAMHLSADDENMDIRAEERLKSIYPFLSN